jgi:hypothetical protein
MNMTKAQKKYHRAQMMSQNVDKLDSIDEFKGIENIMNRTAEREVDERTYGTNKF